MDTLAYILLFTFIASIASLIGGIILLSKEKLAMKISHYLLAFAAGVLLGTAFLDLLPEAAEEAEGGDINIFLLTVVGFLVFFLLERFIHWFHHHHEHDKNKKQSIVPLIVLGDGIHNFIDGVVIAATFMVNIPLGIITSLAIMAHEIPQEIGDFAILLHRGLKKKRILMLNVISALASVLGALLTFWAGEMVESLLPVFLSLTAGFFIYIAASDLVPEIHNEENKRVALIETALMIFGVFIIGFFVSLLEGH